MEASGSDTTEREALERAGGAPGSAGPDTDERTVWLDTSESTALAGDTSEREGVERDTTDDWRIEPTKAPATVAELEARIDAAMVTARAAEEAAMEMGAAGLEAAEQARRAAELAERASAAASHAASEAAAAAESAAASRAAAAPSPALNAAPAGAAPDPSGRPDFKARPSARDPRRPDPFEERITAFRLRAEKVMIRLQKLEAGMDPGSGPTEVVRLR
jgi:nucleoid-associated protein YgaU